MNSLLPIFCIFWFMAMSRSAKVVVFVQNVNSHIIYHARIARLLADEDHVVDMIIPSCARTPEVLKNSSVRVLSLQMNSERCAANNKKTSQLFFNHAMSDSKYKKLVVFREMARHTEVMWSEMCTAFRNDVIIRSHIDDARYDVAIVDAMALNCFTSLVRSGRIPIIVYGAFALEWALRIPGLPSFLPAQLSKLDDRMTFWQRFQNALLHIATYAAFSAVDSQIMPMKAIWRNCSLYFALSDVSIDYPRPTMPQVVFVGDAIPRPGQPLSRHIAPFVESAHSGVIIVSFGSYLDHFPSELTKKFCATFKRVPQKVIWKLNNKTLCDADPSKVLLLDWLPQNDLLSHPNVKLFISHCGLNSILESIYHTTPIIGFPIAIDQPFNARRLESRGFGYEMKINDFSAEELITKIADILSDEKISRNVKRASHLLRNKPDTPAKRISYWVEHLATYGDEHLKSKALELNIVQFFCLDVIVVIFAIVFLLTILALVCLRGTFRFLLRCLTSRKQKYD